MCNLGKSYFVEGGFFFCGGWNFSKSVSQDSTFIREMRVDKQSFNIFFLFSEEKMAHSVVSDISGEHEDYFYAAHLRLSLVPDGQNSEISELLANETAKGELKYEKY